MPRKIIRPAFGSFALALAIAGPGGVASHAAEVSVVSNEIILEGKIEAGDFDKLEKLARDAKPRSIFVASPGGNLAEAIKIGRLVRALNLWTKIPGGSSVNPRLNATIRERTLAQYPLKDPKNNYLCTSACFFVFIAGVRRSVVSETDEPVLAIHRPFRSTNGLAQFSSDQAVAAANQLRGLVEYYLREMSIPAKYADLMMFVPRDQVRMISKDEFYSELDGIIPELKDWFAARCDKRTDAEKALSQNVQATYNAGRSITKQQEDMLPDLYKKNMEIAKCERETQVELSRQAWQKVFGNK
jgi:hypothetical protein